jgi:hypothetical protein
VRGDKAASVSKEKKDNMKQHDEYVKELARRLCAATLSCELRVSLQHAYNNWIKTQESEIGDYWISLAQQVVAACQSQTSRTATKP